MLISITEDCDSISYEGGILSIALNRYVSHYQSHATGKTFVVVRGLLGI